jgi:hypothetical protein
MNKEFWAIFLKDLPLAVLWNGFIFAGIGLAFHWAIKVANRDMSKAHCVQKFNWRIFISQNLKKGIASVVSTVIIIFITIRFFDIVVGLNAELMMMYCFAAGFSINYLTLKIPKLIKKFTGEDKPPEVKP